MRKFIAVSLMAAFLAFGAQTACSQQKEKVPGKGDDFIDFKLKGLDGKTYDTAKLRKGKFSVIQLGQTTCPACRYQSKILKELYPGWKKHPLAVLQVYLAEPVEAVKNYLKKNETPYTVLLDGQARMARRYKIRFIPVVFVLDPDGKIIYKGNLTDKKYFEKELIPLLEKELKKKAKET